MIFTQQSAAYEAVYESGITGLVGVVSMMVVDNDGNTITAASIAGITETLAGSGVYVAERIAPGDTGQYTLIWSLDGSFDDITVTIDDLIVAALTGAEPLAPLTPPSQVGAIDSGPCSAWTTEEAVAGCCSVDISTDVLLLEGSGGGIDQEDGDAILLEDSDFDSFTVSIDEASELLYLLSGRLYAGSCQSTARPCVPGECGSQVLSRGHIVWSGYWGPATNTGVASDRILLSGYPVREIVEVVIDGVVVDEDTYELRGHRHLVRLDGNWPRCDDSNPDAFTVTYLHGTDPPLMGQLAAAELACELYKACTPDAGECALPTGVTRVTRQGVVIERLAFTAWGLQGGSWRTGLQRVDAFLNAVNPERQTRRPAVWSPASHLQYARREG